MIRNVDSFLNRAPSLGRMDGRAAVSYFPLAPKAACRLM